MSSDRAFILASDHLRITVRLTPRASTDRVEGLATLPGGRQVLLARVRALPDSGRANIALKKLLARELSVPPSTVDIISGHKSRLKLMCANGDADALLDSAQRLWPISRQKKDVTD